MLELEAVSKSYGAGVLALRSVSLGVAPGERLGVVSTLRYLRALDPCQGPGELPLALGEGPEQLPLLGAREHARIVAVEAGESVRVAGLPHGTHHADPSR